MHRARSVTASIFQHGFGLDSIRISPSQHTFNQLFRMLTTAGRYLSRSCQRFWMWFVLALVPTPSNSIRLGLDCFCDFDFSLAATVPSASGSRSYLSNLAARTQTAVSCKKRLVLATHMKQVRANASFPFHPFCFHNHPQFKEITDKYPTLLKPMHQLQLAITENLFGRKWWDQRRLDFKTAREMLQSKENLVNKVSQSS